MNTYIVHAIDSSAFIPENLRNIEIEYRANSEEEAMENARRELYGSGIYAERVELKEKGSTFMERIKKLFNA